MNRNYQLDFFRGFFLIIITVDHFFSKTNVIKHFTHEYVGWVSAAEGFVFLSGLTAGLVYTHKLVQKGQAHIATAAKKRAWTIYKYHIILLFLTIMLLFSHYSMQAFWAERFSLVIEKPLLAAVLGSLLHYQPIYFDILPMYAVFILPVPLIVKGFQRGYFWQILSFSCFVYLIGTSDIRVLSLAWLPQSMYFDFGAFDLLCWQLLFVAGLLVGHLMYHGRTGVMVKNRGILSVSILLSVSLFFLKTLLAEVDSSTLDSWLGSYSWLGNYSFVDKGNLRPVRLLNFTSLFFIVAFIASKYKRWFTYKPLCYLGTHSLEVFSLHIILVMLLKPLKEQTNGLYALPMWDGLYLYPVATLLLLCIMLPALFAAPMLVKRKKKGLKAALASGSRGKGSSADETLM